MSEPVQWLDPVAGYEFQPGFVVVTPEHQAEKLDACGLDPTVFSGCVDPAFYIGLGIHAGINNGISAEGNINMLTRLTQHRPVSLGEELTSRGYIETVTDVPRGKAVSTDVWFEEPDGNRVIAVPRKSLKPDPDKRGASGAGDRPPLVIEDPATLVSIAEYQLTPERVKAYSSEGNSIHYEMEAAVKAGFRAPIIGGGMGVHYLLSNLWQAYHPTTLDLDIYFRRPVFWDDTFTVAVKKGDEHWSAIALIRDNKVLTEARINKID